VLLDIYGDVIPAFSARRFVEDVRQTGAVKLV